MKKIFLSLLCAAMTMSLWATDPVVGDTITFTYKGNTLAYKISAKSGGNNRVSIVYDNVHKPSGSLVIPNTITDEGGTEYKVNVISMDAFNGHSNELTSIDFSENTYITTTNQSSFRGCVNVTSIILSDYITEIARYSFQGCKLTSIDLKNVEAIGMANFGSCNITSVHLPKSLSSLADQTYLFRHATTITIDEENTKFAVVGNVLYNKALTKIYSLPLGLTSGELHIEPTATAAIFGAMDGCKATVYFNSRVQPEWGPDYRNSPGGDVIVGCRFYDFYTSGTFIGGDLGVGNDFSQITSLTAKLLDEVNVVATNGTVVFNDTTDCNQVKVTVTADDGYTFVDWFDGVKDNPRTFIVTGDTTVTANIKKNLVVGDAFFAPTVEGVNVTYKILAKEAGKMEVQIGNGNNAAIGTSLTGNVTIPEKVAYYDEVYDVVAGGNNAFKLCQIDTLRLPNSILRLGKQFVYESKLKYVNIPNQLEYIPTFAFAYLYYMDNIAIPASVKYVGYGAFSFDNQLATLEGWDPSRLERVGAQVFYNATKQENALTKDNGFLYSGDIAIGGNGASQGRVIAFKEGTRIIAARINSNDACEKVIFPASVEAIASHMFTYINALDTVVVEALTPPVIYYGINNGGGDIMTDKKASDMCDGGVPNQGTLKYYVPKSAVAAYKSSETWKMVDLRPIGGWTITFVDHDGEHAQQVEQGEMPVIPAVEPYYTEEHMYVFDHWDVTPVAATADVIYTAVYDEQALPTYYVCFYATEADALAKENRIHRVEKVRGSSAVENGVTAAGKLTPRACEMVTDWNGGDLTNVTSEMHVWPTWGTGRFTVVFYVDSVAVKTLNNVECGDEIEAPTDFDVPAGKMFDHWDSDAWQHTEALSGNLDIHAVLVDAPSGVNNIQDSMLQCTKVMIDGQLYIIRGEHIYNAQGKKVK